MHVVFGAAGALGAAIVQNLAQQNKAARYSRYIDRIPHIGSINKRGLATYTRYNAITGRFVSDTFGLQYLLR